MAAVHTEGVYMEAECIAAARIEVKCIEVGRIAADCIEVEVGDIVANCIEVAVGDIEAARTALRPAEADIEVAPIAPAVMAGVPRLRRA